MGRSAATRDVGTYLLSRLDMPLCIPKPMPAGRWLGHEAGSLGDGHLSPAVAMQNGGVAEMQGLSRTESWQTIKVSLGFAGLSCCILQSPHYNHYKRSLPDNLHHSCARPSFAMSCLNVGAVDGEVWDVLPVAPPAVTRKANGSVLAPGPGLKTPTMSRRKTSWAAQATV